MSTNYPGAFDNTTDLKNDASDATVTATTHAQAHNNVADAILAIETALGTNPSGTYADVATALLDKVVKTPGADQIIQPSGDFVGISVKANSAQNLANLIDIRNSTGTIIGFWDRNGNLSAAGFKVGGTALASTHLSDSSALARLAGPTFTGTPAAPTAAVDTSTTQLATTAFVLGQAAAVTPLMDGVAAIGTSTRFARADHVHATDTSLLSKSGGTLTGLLTVAAAGIQFNDGTTLTTGSTTPVGTVSAFAGSAAPSGWLMCDGSAVSRTTYATLYNTMVTNKGAVTVTIASPGVFTFTAHGLVEGDTVFFETTGALPTGLTADTNYYVIATGLTADNFRVSTTRGGSAVNTSGSQSGTHTLFYAPYGVAGSVSTFNLPDMRQRHPMGKADSGTAQALGETGGAIDHTHTAPSHTHSVGSHTHGFSGSTGGPSSLVAAGDTQAFNRPSDAHTHSFSGTTGSGGGGNTGSGGGSATSTNNAPFQTVNYIIKH